MLNERALVALLGLGFACIVACLVLIAILVSNPNVHWRFL